MTARLMELDALLRNQGEVQNQLMELLRRKVHTSSGEALFEKVSEMKQQEESLLKERYRLTTQLLEELGEKVSSESADDYGADPNFARDDVPENPLDKRAVLRRGQTVIAAKDEWNLNRPKSPPPTLTTESSAWHITDPSAVHINQSKILGSGAFGIVYAGEYLGKEVAIKKLHVQSLDASEEKEFIHEAQVMASLRHPNLLLLIGACIEQDNMLMVTEMMSRGSVYGLLHPRVRRDGRATTVTKGDLRSSGRGQPAGVAGGEQVNLSFKRRMLFAQAAAQGMNALHSMSPPMLHRDFKTANLLVDENWVVKVSDFGLAAARRIAAHDGSSKEKTQVGSPYYMAPEVLLGTAGDTKADVYAFGISLWELATERDPWDHIKFSDLDDIVQKVGREHLRPPLCVEDAGGEAEGKPVLLCRPLQDLIRRCWDSDPTKRPSFSEILSSNVFDSIIVEQLVSDVNSGARDWWRTSFGHHYVVPWEEFATKFLSTAGLPTGQFGDSSKATRDEVYLLEQAYDCLRIIVSPESSGGDSSSVYVSLERFGEFLEWFGPWSSNSKAQAHQVVERYLSLCRKPYFHGFMDQHQAKILLSSNGDPTNTKAKKKKGAYLVRFSATEPGCFTLGAVKSDKAISHWRIVRLGENRYRILSQDFKSIEDVIEHFKHGKVKDGVKLLRDGVPCPTPFSKIFNDNARSLTRDTYAVSTEQAHQAYMSDIT